MKKPLYIFAAIVMAVLFLYACDSTIRTWNTSIVTITIGESRQEAVIHAERATPWKQLEYFLADMKIVPEAQAYIPSIVQVIAVTVSAPDMATIAAIDDVSNKTSTAIRLEVSNGKARQFTVEGIRGIDGRTYYRGVATTDLDGTDISLPVNMSLAGPGSFVDFLKGADSPATTGTSTDPFQTITYAMSRMTASTDAIFVQAGTYPPGGAGPGESYPLQLKPGMALVCTGTNHSTILNPVSTMALYGNDGASIDNCRIVTAISNIGIDDRPGGQQLVPKGTRMNNVQVELSGNVTGGSMIGIDLYNDSTVLESAITGSGASGSIIGIRVSSGQPVINGSTITGIPTGIAIAASGTPVISGNTFESNTTGVSISAGTPLISAGTFTSNIYGITISSGSPSITSSTFHGCTYGIWVTGGSPTILTSTLSNNSYGLYVTTSTGSNPAMHSSSLNCNYYYNLYSSTTATIDVSNNSWENYPPTVLDQLNCLLGSDICYAGPAPIYQPYNAAVPGVCFRAPS